jgi:hypothetical protein
MNDHLVALRLSMMPIKSNVGYIAGTMLIACASLSAALLLAGTALAASDEASSTHGLLLLYIFDEPSGEVIHDRSGAGEPLDLKIETPQAISRQNGVFAVTSPAKISSTSPAKKIIEAVKQSSELTIEVWVRPADDHQAGPARIVSLSADTLQRNFTLGQERDRYDGRLRTTKTDPNGIPSLSTPAQAVRAEWTHVVYTRDRAGSTRIYLNGQQSAAGQAAGDLSSWNGEFRLSLANELTQDRPWLGGFRKLAVYARARSAAEVEQSFRAGAGVPLPATAPLAADRHPSARLFETRIAPLISKHCLECHDTAAKQGGLDLSRRSGALAGGKSGPAFVAGKADDSRLWRRVEPDEMPHNRPPLAAAEKALIKEWLNGPAGWSLEAIDPAVYEHGEGAKQLFVQRLAVAEYIESVRSALGVDIAKEALEILPVDSRADGFSNTAYNLKVDLPHVEAYARLAEIAAERLDVKTLAARGTKSRELTDENITKVIEPLGRRLLRGPLSKEEIAMYCGVSTNVAGAGGDIEEAIRYVVQAMLQSPRFLYRMERQRGDGSRQGVGPYEMASRLSYILWGAGPDDDLLQAATKGKLGLPDVQAQARRMLGDRRAVERSRQFVIEWLDLDRLDHLSPNAQKFPRWEERLAADMRAETLAYFEEIIWKQKRPLADLLNAPLTFATPRLAKHYGLPLDKQAAGDGLARYDLTSTGRGGLLTQGSVLTIGGDEASMVARGLFVLRELLRGVVRDPPPCVDTTPVSSKPGLTQRSIAEARLANQSCAGCHLRFEPLAFGLEKFDGLGAYHEADEHGNRLRNDGSVLLPGEERPIAYQSARELMDLLAKSERVRETLTWKVTQFALGRPLGADDAAAMANIHRRAQQDGGTYASLMTAIVTSELVVTTRTEPAE